MNFDVIVLGSGPGGYVTAIRASQLGLKTAIIEKESLGGVCLNWGCIPTKALLKSAQVFEYINHAEDFGISVEKSNADFDKIIKRSRDVADGMSKGISYLTKKNKIEVIYGFGKLKKGGVVSVENDGKNTEYKAKHIIIATGARSRELPNLPQDGKNIIGYREAMTLKKMPEKMVVVGSGAIGVEFAYFYNALGVDVTVVEYMPNIVPVEDEDISKQLQRSFKKSGIKVMTNSSVEKVNVTGSGCEVLVKTKKGDETIHADVVLSAVGITANIENIGLEDVGIKTENGKLVVDEFYNTNVQGYYAIGDLLPTQALAHVASAEGIVCVEKIAGENPEPIDYGNIPGCTYCRPQVASIGLTEKNAKSQNLNIKVGKFPFIGNGKAIALGDSEGMIKTIFNKDTGELIGAHMVGPEVTELIQGFSIAKKLETTEQELMHTIFPHPTLSESMHESVLDAYNQAIHY